MRTTANILFGWRYLSGVWLFVVVTSMAQAQGTFDQPSPELLDPPVAQLQSRLSATIWLEFDAFLSSTDHTYRRLFLQRFVQQWNEARDPPVPDEYLSESVAQALVDSFRAQTKLQFPAADVFPGLVLRYHQLVKRLNEASRSKQPEVCRQHVQQALHALNTGQFSGAEDALKSAAEAAASADEGLTESLMLSRAQLAFMQMQADRGAQLLEAAFDKRGGSQRVDSWWLLTSASEAWISMGDAAQSARVLARCRQLLHSPLSASPGGKAWLHGLVAAHWRYLKLQQERDAGFRIRATQDAIDVLTYATKLMPDDHKLRQFLAAAHEGAGHTALLAKDLKVALQHYRSMQDVFDVLLKVDPSSVEWHKALALALENAGDALSTTGHWQEALEHYRLVALTLGKIQTSPLIPDIQKTISVVHNKSGDTLRAQGQLDEAMKHYQSALRLRKAQLSLRPESPEWQALVSYALERIGNVLADRGHFADALLVFQEKLAIAQHLVALSPAEAEPQLHLAICHDRIGWVQIRLAQYKAALTNLGIANSILERQTEGMPDDQRRQSFLSANLEKLGDLQLQTGDPNAALRSHQKAFGIVESLVRQYPDKLAYLIDLNVKYNRLGLVYAKQQNWPQALSSYQQGLRVVNTLAAQNPGNLELQAAAAFSHAAIGGAFAQQLRWLDAISSYQEALNFTRKLLRPGSAEPAVLQGLLERLDVLADAMDRSGNVMQGLKYRLEALAVSEQRTNAAPTDTDIRSSHFYYLLKACGSLLETNQPAEVVRLLQPLMDTSKWFVGVSPLDLNRMTSWTSARFNLGKAYLKLGDTNAARINYLAGLDVEQNYQPANDSEQILNQNLSILHKGLGDLSHKKGQFIDARFHFNQQRTYLQILADQFPLDPQRRMNLAATLADLAEVHLLLGDKAAAYQNAMASAQIWRELVRLAPVNTEWAEHLVHALIRQAEAASRVGDTKGSLAAYEEVMPHIIELQRAQVKVPQRQAELALAQEAAGVALSKMNDKAKAVDYYRQALHGRKQLLDAAPADAQANFYFERISWLLGTLRGGGLSLDERRKSLEAGMANLNRRSHSGQLSEQIKQGQQEFQRALTLLDAEMDAAQNAPIEH